MPTPDLTTKEFAERAEVAERTVRDWIEQKVIHAYKLNPKSKSVYRIPLAELERTLRERSGATIHPKRK